MLKYSEYPIAYVCGWQENCTFLNHGAFGGTLREAMEVAQVVNLCTTGTVR